MSDEAKRLRDLGDAERDRGSWVAAGDAYRSYLDLEPADAAIWVQLGHALKESGRHEDADTAYHSALALTPQDADLLLQLGHLMKLRGRARDAAGFYESAILADPLSPGFRELVSIGQSARAERALHRARAGKQSSTTFFQIDDLLIYLSSLKTVSGIQRTVVEVMRYVLDHAAEAGDRRHAFVFTELFGTQLIEAPAGLLRGLVEYLDEPDIAQSELVKIIHDIKANAVPATIVSGSCYVMLGAFWGVVNNSNVLSELKRAGVRIGVYLYDLIPIDYPEFCDPTLVNDFAQSLTETLCFVDFAFAISEFSAQAVRRFLQVHDFPAVKVEVVRLAHSLSAIRDSALVGNRYLPSWSSATRDLKGRSFVLYVSTIEARKNHKYLFDIWKRLIAEGVEVPDLVFVGRHGWRVNEFFEQLKSTRYLDGKIHILHDLSDLELETLYRECKFTAFTSIIEGWGLPVGESLGYGKVCLAGGTSSMQEVGGDLIPYVDPLNMRDGLEVIRRLITDPSVLETYEAGIKARFVPRTWSDVSREILSLIERTADASDGQVQPAFVPVIEPCRKVLISAFSPFAERPPREARHRVQRLLLSGSWHRAEGFGAWMEGAEGGVQFATMLRPGEQAVVFLELTAPEVSTGNFLVLTGPGGWKRTISLMADTVFTARVVVATDAESRIRLDFRVGGAIGRIERDMRSIGLGLVSLTYVAAEDGVGRAEILERMLFDAQVNS